MVTNVSAQRVRQGAATTSQTRAGHAVMFLFSILLAAATYGLPIVLDAGAGSAAAMLAGILFITLCTVLLVLIDVESYLVYWLTLVLTQNALTGLWLQDGEQASFVVTESKSLSLGIAVLIYLPRIIGYLRRHPRLGVATLVYLGAILISVRKLDASMLGYARNFLVPLALALFVAACYERVSAGRRRSALLALVALVTAYLSVGSFLELVVGRGRWLSLFNATGNMAVSVSGDDSTSFFGVQLDRTSGFILEPVTAGYLAAGALVALIVANSGRAARHSRLASGLLIVLNVFVIYAAGTKSSLLMVATALIILILTRVVPRLRPVMIVIWAILISIAATLSYLLVLRGPSALTTAFTDPIRLVHGDSVAIHWSGLVLGVRSGFQTVLGNGLGNGGNLGIKLITDFDSSARIATGAESAVGVLAYQAGAVALVALLALSLILAREWGRASAIILGVWLGASLTAESMFGPAVASIFMLAMALLSRPEPPEGELPPIQGRGVRTRRSSPTTVAGAHASASR